MSMLIDPDLLFPAEERTRSIARKLYAEVRSLLQDLTPATAGPRP